MLIGGDRHGELTISFIPLSSSSFSSAYKYKGTHSNRAYPSHLLQLLFFFPVFFPEFPSTFIASTLGPPILFFKLEVQLTYSKEYSF